MAYVTYKPLTIKDDLFLREMLFQALFVPPGKPKLDKTILNSPDIKLYVENWGTKYNDIGILASFNDCPIGAVWCRQIKGYGFVNESTPELAMAILPNYRNQGIGSILLSKIEKACASANLKQISLSVDKLNPAAKLYLKKGYVIHEEKETSYVMIKAFT